MMQWRAIEYLRARLKKKVIAYMPFIRFIGDGWDKQLYNLLHATDCFLNLGNFLNPCFKNKTEVLREFMTCDVKLKLDLDKQYMIIKQLELYKNVVGDFGDSLAILRYEKTSPTIIDIICYLVWIYILTYVLFKCN